MRPYVRVCLLHLRYEREVLEGLDEEQQAVDGADVVHLLQLEHEWLQVDVISVALHATDEVEHLEGVAYEVPG